jgi:hydrogenase expression/formation protein HypE
MSESGVRRPRVNPHRERVVLAHGGGGQLTEDLLRDVVFPRFTNEWLDLKDDSALLPVTGPVAFTTDAYVVKPIEFPGGDIGRLSVCGTVNDLAVAGADPKWLSLALILEEGLAIPTLERLLDSAAAAAREAGVAIVAGDTKVVPRGEVDEIYVTTSGVGILRDGRELGFRHVRPGDAVLISGTIADHGLAVMLQRQPDRSVRSDLTSDVAPLSALVRDLLDAAPGTSFLRDPTRGGLAGVAADLAEGSGYRVTLDETRIPVRRETRYAAEMLGLDPLTVANEGKVVAVVPEAETERALAALRENPLGRDAAVIGHVGPERDGTAELVTEVGGVRIVVRPYGEELPRIC